jgi:hypothetical protein
VKEIVSRQKDTNRILDRLGAGGAVEEADDGHFGECHPFLSQVEHVLLAAGSVLVYPNGAPSHDEDAGARVPFLKDHLTPYESLDSSHGSDSVKRLLGQCTEEPASLDDIQRFLSHGVT